MTKTFCPLCLVAFFTLAWSNSSAEVTLPEKFPDRPRLLFTKQKEAEIKELMKTDPFLEKIVAELLQGADRVKNDPQPRYVLANNLRLNSGSGQSMSLLAFAYRMTGNKEYADAAIKIMQTACRFPDWNPLHFLDVSGFSQGVSLAYDWLYDVLTEEQREEFKNALVSHALKPGLESYVRTRIKITFPFFIFIHNAPGDYGGVPPTSPALCVCYFCTVPKWSPR